MRTPRPIKRPTAHALLLLTFPTPRRCVRQKELAELHGKASPTRATLARLPMAMPALKSARRAASRPALRILRKRAQVPLFDFDRKCCNFENGDGGRPERSWAARFQAARSNSWSMN